jgi:hypothetical protein
MITLDILESTGLRKPLVNTFGGQRCDPTSQTLCPVVILARKINAGLANLDTFQKKKPKPNHGIRCA